jgi:hypothetical protein
VALLLEAASAGLALGTQRSTVLTIADNDAGGTIGFTTGTMTVSDAAGVANVTVKRTGGVAGGVSVDYVASFSDATSFFGSRRQTGTLVFGPGQTSRTITLALSTDPLIRGERVFVELGIVEGTTAVVTVLRTGGLAGGVRVPFTMFDGTTGGFSARNGLDFVLDSGAVVFEEGETTKTIAIPIFADALLEGPETFKLFLSTPSGGGTLGTPSTMLVTIVDPEAAVGFDRGFVQVDELTPAVTVTALRSGSLTGTATVQFRTIEGTGAGNAVPDVDYRPVQKTLTFAAGVATQTVTIPLLNDTTVDGQRTVRLELSNAVGVALGTAQRTMNITITDNEFGGTIELADSQFVASEAAGVATVRVLRTLPSIFGVNSPALGGGVVVNFTATAQSASLGSDFTIASGAVTFTGTETTKDIVIPIVGDGVAEGPESFVVTLPSVTGGGSRGLIRAATVTIVD